MHSSELRHSFLSFFRHQGHSILPSSSLLPDAPNLLFTNAGMNQFVPIFVGQIPSPYQPPRAANSQKCIRAGGKHNDLEEVGLDTYHHTFFEMLGNWSFGDYFKKEAIQWAWELLVEVWNFPPQRLYATIYKPLKGDPASFDQEAYDLWATLFSQAGLDPKLHLVPGNRQDNFWMMGETGPCGPCSEIHVDLTPDGNTQGALVNQGSAECLEIWNLVFIQFNANADGTFTPLKQCHVDTGMGFERLCAIMQGTNGLTQFSNVHISNYEIDLFQPIFQQLEAMSHLRYRSTLPKRAHGKRNNLTKEEQSDVAFRVIADHLRTLGFAIADGIEPGNSERNYVLRRLLRRAVGYGRHLGFSAPFLHQLVPFLTTSMGDAFPELRTHQEKIASILHREEESFYKTLERGLSLFEEKAEEEGKISAACAFKLYDEQGFPFDLTELLARERGLDIDHGGFEKLMEEQRQRARRAQKKEVLQLSSLRTVAPTLFLGFNHSKVEATLLAIESLGDKRTALIFDRTVFYGQMGGQVGDCGIFQTREKSYPIIDTKKQGALFLHIIEGEPPPLTTEGILIIDLARRRSIERHHTATHLLHWALRKILGPTVVQKGSYVGSEKFTFDFNSAPLKAEELRMIENLLVEEILNDHIVTWQELPYSEVKQKSDIMQFFGEKYNDHVRVVQIGGEGGKLNGFSMELCGGTHVERTSQIGFFRIISEGAVASGIRRIEAVAGLRAHQMMAQEALTLHHLAAQVRAPLAQVEQKIQSLLEKNVALEKEVQKLQREAAERFASSLLTEVISLNTIPTIIKTLQETDWKRLEAIVAALEKKFDGVLLLAGIESPHILLLAVVSPTWSQKINAGKLIQIITPLLGGKGGGTSQLARGSGSSLKALPQALQEAQEYIKLHAFCS